MKKILIFCWPVLVLLPVMAQAVNVGEVTSMMAPDEFSLSKEIANTTDSARFVSVTVYRLSSPMAEGVIIPMESKVELLSTPSSLILPGNAKDNFRFFYKGPNDDKERYYRLSWTDEPITESGYTRKSKQGQATTSAVINTILVVGPRNERFDFKREGADIYNTGNAAFRVISFGACKDKKLEQGKGCRERYYIMPGMSVKIKYTDITDKKTRIGIWHGKTYINVK
ncbi:hypothetical protein FJU30_09165 [Affinibrenneria salicis]|uniref:Probable fimbrial chaperone EcpB n=1 Tax=Affinibrenneria salicis TaxID=2590031 RepID=A0A5J5G3Y9_9GAMM|nr:hypothetical protein [Affinibrenneria salicis]KAA9001373.1 hypothetical protein FJU30_09165 [Affinibrenneria salicis]